MATETLTRKPIKIERNIPLPKYTKLAQPDNLVEDLKKMKVLDSRLIDVEYTKESLNATRTRIHTIVEREEIDAKFTTNIDPVTQQQHEKDKSVKVLLRVWRVQ
jgi:hypothetical protein